MILRCFYFEVRSKRVVLHGLSVIAIFEQLLLFLCVDDMLYSFYALKWAFKEIADVCFVGVGLNVLVVIFLLFIFGVSTEMDGRVGVVAE